MKETGKNAGKGKTSARKKTPDSKRKWEEPLARTPAPRIPTPGSARSAAGTGRNGLRSRVTPEERYKMIAEAAYYIAQKRGFVGGNPAQDWGEAEAQIDARLLERQRGEE